MAQALEPVTFKPIFKHIGFKESMYNMYIQDWRWIIEDSEKPVEKTEIINESEIKPTKDSTNGGIKRFIW